MAVVVPPQVFDSPFGVATARPLGKVSLKLTPLRATAAFGLLILNVRLVVLPVMIELAPKDLAMTGGATTLSEEVPKPAEVVFGPVSVEEMLLLVFVYCPAVAPVTVTLIVQEPLAAIVPPERAIVRGAVVVSVPLQAEDDAEATVKPAGKTSEKETPVNEVAVLGLLSRNVNVLVLP